MFEVLEGQPLPGKEVMFKSALVQVTARKLELEQEIGEAIAKQFAPRGIYSSQEIDLARRVVRIRTHQLEAIDKQFHALTAMIAMD